MQMQVFGPLHERIYKNIELLNAPYMELNSNWTECVNEKSTRRNWSKYTTVSIDRFYWEKNSGSRRQRPDLV
jgi:hypothetical protein